MRNLVLAGALFGLGSAALAATYDTLPAAVAAFIDEERVDATTERKDAIAACLLTAFDGVPDEFVASVLAEEDFEDGLEMLIEQYPEREQIIETCEDI